MVVGWLFADLCNVVCGLHMPRPQIKSFCYWQQPGNLFVYLYNHGDEVTKGQVGKNYDNVMQVILECNPL